MLLDDTQPTKPFRESPPVRPSRPPYGFILAGVSLIAVTLLGAALLMGALLTTDSPLSVTIEVNGLSYSTTTTADTVRALLADEDITLHTGSFVQPAPETPLTENMRVVVDTERSISLTVNGLTSVFRTVNDNPREILEMAGVIVTEADEIRVNGSRIELALLDSFPLPVHDIFVRHAVTVRIQDEDGEITLTTTADTVGDALFEAGLTLYLGDSIFPAPETPLTQDTDITITRSTPVTITADGITTETRASGGTVADALREAGIALNGLDYPIPAEPAALRPGMSIRVVRVTETLITEDISVPYESIYQADSALELDQRRITQGGVNGVDRRTIRIRYEDGVEVNRRDEGVMRVQDPVNEVVNFGTNVVIRTVETPEGTREYWRTIRMYATSYHPAALGGDDVTATGRRLTKGIVAIDPRVIPYGTQVYVGGYGVGLAADTGGRRSTRRWIDLGYDDENYESWSGWVEVYVLTPVPDNITYVLPP